MNEIAWTGIKDVLNKLGGADLHGLAATVTQGLLKPKRKSREEVVDAILKYSPDVLSILKRRAITKEVLFAYLHDKNIAVELPTTRDKLLDKIYQLWNLTPNKDDVLQTFPTPTSQEAAPSNTESNVNIMAKQFTQWFYEMLNNKECIDIEHFYPDAHLKLNMISDSSQMTDEMEGPNAIVELLFKTKTDYNLFFNPNLSWDGVQGRLDPHGLVLVLACGTLHTNECCVGVFEQVFSLARDPYCENNWKIKTTELNLRSTSGDVDTPNLSNSGLTSRLLALPSR